MKGILVLTLLLLVGFVSADCSGGYLRVLDVADRVGGEDVVVVVQTNISNINVTRNLDVVFIDPEGNHLNEFKTRFDDDRLKDSVEFHLKTNGNMLNGSYKFRAKLDVWLNPNMTDYVCGQIEYSNNFWIKTGRRAYKNSPFELDISTPFMIVPYKYYEKKCVQGHCLVVNTSGELPANFTIVPYINWNPTNDTTKHQLNISAKELYDGGVLLALSRNLSLAHQTINTMSRGLLNMTETVGGLQAEVKSLGVDVADAEEGRGDALDELQAYKDTHPIETLYSIIIGVVLGVLGCYGYLVLAVRQKVTDNRHEEA